MLLEIFRRLVNYLFYRTGRVHWYELNDRLLKDIGYEPGTRLPTRDHYLRREHWTDFYL
ncbi:hypothetical protein [Aestuariispira insulae]|uniref:Uncharacterized protein n=1 Tax=Aestuariispira insulae TaxID=1461337 RepID=A0A3D9HXD2_9PROT|nr:hypothetical protein [Aestuariispira insulae]RED54163.1 hypothetical protein DFP90_101966 [Aestuariispira insulae]